MVRRVAVVGASGHVGGLVSGALARAGHDVVAVSRAAGVDVHAGTGLDAALAGADVVVDVLSSAARTADDAVAFFGTTTRHLLAAGARAGVRHHVVLSVVGLERDRRVAHYAGKREQERLVESGPVPYSVVRATQFHDYPAMVADRALAAGVARVPPLLLQPVDAREVAQLLADVAGSEPLGGRVDIAGPRTEHLVDMARRTWAAQGRTDRVEPGPLDPSVAGDAMLAGPGARLGTVTFDEWLAADAVR